MMCGTGFQKHKVIKATRERDASGNLVSPAKMRSASGVSEIAVSGFAIFNLCWAVYS